MNENKWFTCAEFNAKTDANYHKREAERKARKHQAHRRKTSAVRHRNRLIALNMSLVGVMGMALGVLIMYIV